MNYNNPVIKMLETAANMIIVSMLWLIFSVPVITVIPASAALYHTSVHIIFGEGRGIGVVKDFVSSFRSNLKSGVILSMITVLAVLIIAEGLWTGYQIWRLGIPGMLYMILGIVITFVFICTWIHVPPVLSRFDAPVLSILRISAYFGLRHPLRSILFAVLFAALVWMCDLVPLAIVIVPALFTDLIRPYLERDMNTFITEQGLQVQEDEEAEEDADEEEVSSVDLDRQLSEKRKGNR